MKSGGCAAHCCATRAYAPATLRAVDNSPAHRRDEPAAVDSRPAGGTRVAHSLGRRRTVDNRDSHSLACGCPPRAGVHQFLIENADSGLWPDSQFWQYVVSIKRGPVHRPWRHA